MDAMRAPPGTHALHPGTLAPLPGPVAALIGLAALTVMAIPFLWPLVAQFDTMAHEGAHAIVASTVGFTDLGVTLDRDSDGMTTYWGFATGPRRVLTSFAGYLGPSAFGLFAAKLIETGHVIAVLWVAIILLVLLLFLIRKSFGIFSVPAAITLVAVVMHDGHAGFEEVIAYAMAWLLLLAGLRTAVAHGATAGDAFTLAAITPLSRRLWSLLWIAGALMAVVVGGKWLIMRS